ncbi:MAG: hypothetical protein ACREUO_00090 [Burkholderiales bacterium]
MVTLALVCALAPAALADTKSKISAQERRLRWLEGVAREKQAKVASIQASIRAVTAKMRESNLALDMLERRFERHENQLVDMTARYDELQRQTDTTASNLYMSGPISFASFALNAPSFSDAADTVHYAGVVLSQNKQLALQTAKAARDIRLLKVQDEAMIKRRSELLRLQRARQDELVAIFADGQEQLEQIAAIREEVVQLLLSLRRQLRDEELGALGGTMPYGRWADAFLGSIGAPLVRGNQVAMIAWQVAEGTLARWNPLATTWRMPGSTNFNSHRVQNYVSLEQGLDATRATLERPRHRYEAILSNLRAGARAMDTGWAINASDWCRGCADGQYVVELIPIVERYYDRYARRRA